MRQFIGRQKELQALNRLYQNDDFQMTIMYGRRRVGKSTLLQQFIQGKRAVYYTAIRSSSQRNLDLLTQRTVEALVPELQGISFQTYEQLFSFLSKQTKYQRTVVILDEFPYLAEQDASLLSILQKYIDTEWLQGKMYLILCGSSVSFMEDEVLSEKSPLFGRRTSQLHLQPFNYLEAAKFVPSYTAEEKAIVYGVTGGIAKYLSLFNDAKTLDDNLKQLFFNTMGYLYEEPANLLTQEFRSISTYSAIIEAVAAGRTKMSTIADLTHMDTPKITHAIHNLLETGILKKEYAITDENNRKKVKYVLADNMFRFWYQFVAPDIDIIEFGRGDVHYDHVVKPRLSNYMGEIFEEMCRYYTMLLGTAGKLDCLVTKVGKWWGTNPQKREETDIDVVGLDVREKKAVLGECKFKNEDIDKKIFEQLRERNGLIDRRYRVVQYLLFSKTGFSNWIFENQEKEEILPISLQQMYENI